MFARLAALKARTVAHRCSCIGSINLDLEGINVSLQGGLPSLEGGDCRQDLLQGLLLLGGGRGWRG